MALRYIGILCDNMGVIDMNKNMTVLLLTMIMCYMFTLINISSVYYINTVIIFFMLWHCEALLTLQKISDAESRRTKICIVDFIFVRTSHLVQHRS